VTATDPIKLTFYSTAPKLLDIVWCRWPIRKKPGFKDRPALVNRIFESGDGRFAVEVCYGTSRVEKKIRGVGSFVIAPYSELTAMGLYHNTRFELLTTQTLPWAEEVFPQAPGRRGPVLGHLTNRQKIRLQTWSAQTKVVVAGLRASEDGNSK